MIDQEEIYRLTGEPPWVDFPDPGYHRQPAADTIGQRDAEALFNANTMVFTSQQNVKGAINDALNEAVPKAYRRNPVVIGVREYRPNDSPRDIIAALTVRYGQKTTTEINEQDEKWRRDWTPSEPIEELIDRLEEVYIFAIYMPPAYTPGQLIDRAHNAVKRTGLYSRAVVEWEAFPEVNKTWPEWKEHFIEAYEAREASGVTSGGAGYHGASNVYDDEVTLDESLAQIHVANNAAMQGVQSNLSTITDETRELRAALVATQQQLANLMAGNSAASTGWPRNQVLTQPQYAAMPPPMYPEPAQYAAMAQPYQGPPAQYAAPAYQNNSYAQNGPPPQTQPPPTVFTQQPATYGGYGGGTARGGGRGRSGRGGSGGRGRG